MPYIPKHRRIKLDISYMDGAEIPANAGELNYVFTEVIRDYLLLKGDSYQVFNDIVGALEGCKAEFQRRIVNPYEDKKMEENGDVYS